MSKDENFKKVKDLDKGEIVIKLPGTDMKMAYSSGEAFVNEKGTVAYNALKVYDVFTESTGKAEGLLGMLGEQLAEQLNDPLVKGMVKEMISKEDTYLFYSRTKDGKDVITMPSMREDEIDDKVLEGKVLAGYSTARGLPSMKKVYKLHMKAVGKRELTADKESLEKETDLVPKVNDVYKELLKLMEETGF